MRDDALAVDCPAREPDPVLLEQLTALAAASTAPAVKPWWQRLTAKTGAAAVAGVLLISGATADAEHAPPQPIIATIVEAPGAHHAKPHHPATPPAAESSAVWSTPTPPMSHAGTRTRHARGGHGKKNQDGHSDGGGSRHDQGDGPQLSRLATPLQAFATPVASSASPVRPHGHERHSHSQH